MNEQVSTDAKTTQMLTRDQEVWLRAWCSVASRSDHVSSDTARAYAGHALHDFKAQFDE